MEDNQNYGQQPPYGGQQYSQQPDGSQPYGQQPYGGQQYNQQYGQQQTPYAQQTPYVRPVVYDALPTKHSGVSIAALVCGILGIVFFWLPFVDLMLNIAGLVCAIIVLTKKYDGKGLAIGGLVTSIIGMLLSLYFMFCFFLGMMLVM